MGKAGKRARGQMGKGGKRARRVMVGLLDITRFWGVVGRGVRREMAINGGVVLCLRRVFVSNVMSSTRLNWREILAEVRNESVFGAKMGVWRRAFWLPRGALRRPWMPAPVSEHEDKACAGKTVV